MHMLGQKCPFKYPHWVERSLICLFHSKQTLASCCQKYPRLPLLLSQHCLQVPSPWKWSPLHEALGSADGLAAEAAWPIPHVPLGDFQTDAYASSLCWQEGWECKDSWGEFMLLWKLNPSWKQYKRVRIKDMTFCLCLESVAWPPGSLLPFIKALVTFFVKGWFSLSRALSGLFYFQQWFLFHLNLLPWPKMCFFIQKVPSVGIKICILFESHLGAFWQNGRR